MCLLLTCVVGWVKRLSKKALFTWADVHYDVAQGVALPNVTLINPLYIGPYEGYFCVCLGCHNLHLH